MPRLLSRTPKMCQDRTQAYVKLDGRRFQLGRWGTPEAREAYDRIIAEWLSNGRRVPVPPAPESSDGPVTVTALCVEYLRWAERRYSRSEVHTIRQALRLLRRLYGRSEAAKFGPKAMRAVRAAMIEGDAEASPPRAPWSRRYANRQVSRIRSVFKWGVSHELTPESVYRQLATVEPLRKGEVSIDPPRVKPVPRHLIRRARPFLTRPIRGLILLQILTGARPAELLPLRPVDIDTTGRVWIYRPQQHKTAHHGKDRMIAFGPRAQKILRLFMGRERPMDCPLFHPREGNAEAKRRGAAGQRRPGQKPTPSRGSGKWRNQYGGGGRDQPRHIGDRYTSASYRRAIHRACQRAFPPPTGLSRDQQRQWKEDHQWSPHQLRHNAATALRREFGIEVASLVLGHSSLPVTELYAEKNNQKVIDVMTRVG